MRNRLPFVITMSMVHTVNANAIRLRSRGGIARFYVTGYVLVRGGLVAP